jgi:hypothetical protein
MSDAVKIVPFAAILFGICCAGARTPAARPAGPKAAAAPRPAAAEPVEEGSTLQAAVLVPAADEDAGVQWENDWIYFHYGRFRKRSAGLASLSGRRYDVITVELSDHTTRIIYFDITRFYGRERR